MELGGRHEATARLTPPATMRSAHKSGCRGAIARLVLTTVSHVVCYTVPELSDQQKSRHRFAKTCDLLS